MKKPVASLMIRDQPHYRRKAFEIGLRTVGFDVTYKPELAPRPDDALVIWNRYGVNHQNATRYERAGATVFVVENGFVEFRGEKKAFAIALNNHNGGGRWYVGPERRGGMLDLDLQPWRDPQDGGDVLLLPQRGIGPPGIAMPRSWVADTRQALIKAGIHGGRIRIREHPAALRGRRIRPLSLDLAQAAVAVVWASGAGIKAIAAGVPTVHCFKHWVGRAGATFGLPAVANPVPGDRETMLEHVGWAQWTVSEVEKGVPFDYLLGVKK